MKNFPHQFNNLDKLYNSLEIIQELMLENLPINDSNFGTKLTQNGVYTFRDKSLSIAEYLLLENEKPVSNRGYLTVARDIRRLFELLKLIDLNEEKEATFTSNGNTLLDASSYEDKILIWKRLFYDLELEGEDSEISHPYRILDWLVKTYPGIETSKLLLALEAKNDSEEEHIRISDLVSRGFDEIVMEIDTTISMARNAVKILPAIAEQLGEDISSSIIKTKFVTQKTATNYWETSANDIAKEPEFNEISDANIDLSNAIKVRQKRLSEHQACVRKLAKIHESDEFTFYEGKFDCLVIKSNSCLLYEVKTLSDTLSDIESQTIKAVGQLKYYNYAIVQKQMGQNNIKEFLVFTLKPTQEIIDFCESISIIVIWLNGESFNKINPSDGSTTIFNPSDFI